MFRVDIVGSCLALHCCGNLWYSGSFQAHGLILFEVYFSAGLTWDESRIICRSSGLSKEREPLILAIFGGRGAGRSPSTSTTLLGVHLSPNGFLNVEKIKM